jgi:hypothetical protein
MSELSKIPLISQLQNYLDENKDKLQESVYLDICNQMKKIFDTTETKDNLLTVKVRVMFQIVGHCKQYDKAVCVFPKYRDEIIRITSAEYDKMRRYLETGNSIIYRHPHNTNESSKHTVSVSCSKQVNVITGEYITFIYPLRDTEKSSFSHSFPDTPNLLSVNLFPTFTPINFIDLIEGRRLSELHYHSYDSHSHSDSDSHSHSEDDEFEPNSP